MNTLLNGGKHVVKKTVDLRLHPAMEKLGLEVLFPDTSQNSPGETILCTQTGLIVGGFSRWRLGVQQNVTNVDAIEHDIQDVDVLMHILASRRQQRGWNAFIRIRLALEMEPGLQTRALANMKIGGAQKGLAILPKAAQIDVRQQIAEMAGVGGRNVSKVKQILSNAHPRVIEELQVGSVSINEAHLLSSLPNGEQVEHLANKYFDRAMQKIEKPLLTDPGSETVLNAESVLDALRDHEFDAPGSVSIRVGRCKRTVVILGEDLKAVILKDQVREAHEV